MRWLRRRTRPSGTPDSGRDRGGGPHPEGFGARVTGLSHVAVVLAPSSDIGPEPLHIPVTGYNLFLELAATGQEDVLLHALRAEVLRRSPLGPAGVAMVPQPGPAISFADDLAEARRRGLENYRPLEVPHVEVFLDETPPLVRQALRAGGEPARPEFALPLRVAAGTTERIVLAPITDDRGRVDWRLTADVSCGTFRTAGEWALLATAETTMRTFHPGGTEPDVTPVHELAPHWKPAVPPGHPR